MGVIDLSAYKPVPATLGDANQVANGFQTIQTLLNGNVDNLNFGAGKIFDPAKLMQNAATDGQGLLWDNANSKWAPFGTVKKLAEVILGASAVLIDITGIPATFAHLLIDVSLREDPAVTADVMFLRFNGDSANNYDWQRLTGQNAGVAAAAAVAQSSARAGVLPGASFGANKFSAGRIHVSNYANAANHKTFEATSGAADTGAANCIVEIASGCWRSVAAINQVTVLPSSGNLIAGSRVTIYGLG